MPIKDPARRRAWFKNHTTARRKLIQEYKLSMGCVDCGYNSSHKALQLDHVPGVVYRHKGLKGCRQLKLGDLMDELSKMDVVCANCHAIRSFDRGQFGDLN